MDIDPIATADSAVKPVQRVASSIWKVRLLGGFEIDNGQQRLTRLRSRAAMSLLARLAMAPQRDHGREELASLLWPEADETSGRARLRQTLSLLRSVLEPHSHTPNAAPVILADSRVLRAAPGALWCDVPAFEQACQSSLGEQARSLYRGELLPGMYDEWIEDERRRLASLRETLVEKAAYAQRLPQYLTRLIGADLQGARLRALVTQHRWVTVIGPGGAGKTRLATEVARWLSVAEPAGRSARFERAVFVSLVGATDARQCLDRALLALRLESAGDAAQLLADALAGQSLLMVLDNAEQLADDAIQAFAALAESLPEAHFLFTSRRPLGTDGEVAFALAALDLPADDTSLGELALNAAVALFVDRARAQRPDFHVQADNAAALANLVRWLEGLPLAIELAASQARTLGPGELLALLHEARADTTDPAAGLDLLARRGTRSGLDSRHASMRAIVEWSWRLLDAQQQHLLTMASIQTAGLTRAGAMALGALGGPGGQDCTAEEAAGNALTAVAAQKLLDSLVAQSVLRQQMGQDGQPRYVPYEPVREYAIGQRGKAALVRDRRRVLHWLLAWAQALPATPPLPTVRDELPNLMEAIAAAPADGQAAMALELVLQLQAAWGEIALSAGVLDSLDRLLTTPGLDDSKTAAGHALAASVWQAVGNVQAVRAHMAAALARPCPDPAQRITVLSRLARMRWRVDKDAAGTRALIEEGLLLAGSAGKPNTEAALFSLKAHLASTEGDHAQARELSARSRALWAQSGNRHLINAGRYNAAVQMLEAGQALLSLTEFEALAAEGRVLQDWDLVAGSFEARGTALLALRRWADSAASLRESLTVAWSAMEINAAVYALWNLAPALARLRQAELAAVVMGAAQQQWAQRFGAFDKRDHRDLKRIRRYISVLLGPVAAQAAWQQGAALSLGEAVRKVLDTNAFAT